MSLSLHLFVEMCLSSSLLTMNTLNVGTTHLRFYLIEVEVTPEVVWQKRKERFYYGLISQLRRRLRFFLNFDLFLIKVDVF